MQDNRTILVGTYGKAKTPTIFTLTLTDGNAKLSPLCDKTANPSFLALSPDRRILYAVEEGAEGKIHSFRMGPTPELLSTQETKGSDPCHILVDSAHHLVLVSNYTSGSLAAFPIKEDGELAPLSFLDQHQGSGPNPDRQEGPHVHCAFLAADGMIYSCDLGLDTIFAYQASDGTLVHRPDKDIALPAGSGPRHLYVSRTHQGLLYCVSELSGEIFVIRDGSLLQELSVRDSSRAGNTTAAVKADPREQHLYVSNRGDDTIAHFAIGEDGLLKLCEISSCGGSAPRDILVLEDLVLCANQNSSTITVLQRADDGTLSHPVQTLLCPHPSCLLPL